MSWDAVFGAANLVALISWIALVFLPRWPALLSALLFLIVGGLCLLYSVGLIGLTTGWLDRAGPDAPLDFGSIESIQALFASKGGMVVGWVHYLAFDLFVGIWIARDADSKGFSRFLQAPILFFTLMAGPLGLLLWLIIREGRARAQGRWT
jgi:hypothetical protein